MTVPVFRLREGLRVAGYQRRSKKRLLVPVRGRVDRDYQCCVCTGPIPKGTLHFVPKGDYSLRFCEDEVIVCAR